MKLYLDNCVLSRPFDDLSQPRIAEEASAVAVILDRMTDGQDEMVDSSALRDENMLCPNLWRRNEIARLRQIARTFQELDDEALQRAGELVNQGFKPFDAAHLALAEASGADYFVTTDDRLLNKAKGLPDLRVKVVDPKGYVEKEVRE